ncbi:hypothetical protein ES703_57642 [subsurface metagenome]
MTNAAAFVLRCGVTIRLPSSPPNLSWASLIAAVTLSVVLRPAAAKVTVTVVLFVSVVFISYDLSDFPML